MFINRQIDSALDHEIMSALEELKKLRDDPQKYDAAVDRIAKLKKQKTPQRLVPPSMDTVLLASANIFGILWLARYERENVIKAPNAFRHVWRLK